MHAAGQVAQLVEQIDAMSGAVSLMREHLAALLALPGQVQDLSEQMSQAVTMLESLAVRQGRHRCSLSCLSSGLKFATRLTNHRDLSLASLCHILVSRTLARSNDGDRAATDRISSRSYARIPRPSW